MKRPNIMFMLAEDMCPNLGCYGDPDAMSPNLDALASDGVRYDHVSSTGPVCSAARTTLALGLYPATVGTGNHRSHVEVPDYVKIFAKYLQDAGYHTAINKTDYNFVERYDGDKIEGWSTMFTAPYMGDDEAIAQCIQDTWRQCEEDQPFFFMHTYAVTHQSRYGYPNEATAHRAEFIPRTKPEEFRDRSELTIPPFHPDTPDTREIWGQYHECVTAMDRCVGETIDRLKEDGIYEDTIILFVGDNGMGIPGGKFAMWNEGTSVPLIARVPEKFQHLVTDYESGSISKKGVTFVDFAPTIMKLAGLEPCDYMQGSSFLEASETTAQEEEGRKYTFSYRNRIDSSCESVRSIRDDRYLYIRHYYPHKGWRLPPYAAISSPYFVTSWEEAVSEKYDTADVYNRENAFSKSRKPAEELYDLIDDPAQMNNLADNAMYSDVITNMRKVLRDRILRYKDGGFIPEQIIRQLAKTSTTYDVIRDESIYPMGAVLDLCDNMLSEEASTADYLKALQEGNVILRFWAVQGLYNDGVYSDEVRQGMLGALDDDGIMVQLAASEAIIALTDRTEDVTKAKEVLKKCLNTEEDVMVPLEAVDALDRLGKKTVDLIPLTERLMHNEHVTKERGTQRYIAAITSLAQYYPERMGQPHDYKDNEAKDTVRFLEYRKYKA